MRLRFFAVPVAGVAAVLAGVVFFGDLNGNLVYYLTPTEAVAQQDTFDDGRRFRLAGEVADGSVRDTAAGVRFTVGDGATPVTVVHAGTPPQLFRAGVPVVVEGAWDGEVFASDTILIKHDADYYPPGDEPVEAAG